MDDSQVTILQGKAIMLKILPSHTPEVMIKPHLHDTQNRDFVIRITEDLIRKSAEHNECVISTLEEVALHQRDIERIEFLDKWCRQLKILDLTSNLIPRIENLSRLKKLEYLKLGLNNIERVENLEGCESLHKLDLTVNFIGELTSIESLKGLVHLQELFLVGNPCKDFEGYKEFVIATLPQLKFLDGIEIERSERIIAQQKLHELRSEIIIQQRRYKLKREEERLNELQKKTCSTADEDPSLTEDERDKRFWEESTAYTPESRLRVHEHQRREKEKRENKGKTEPKVQERRLQASDGRILNVNEAKVNFTLGEDETGENILLDVAVYRFLDTTLCDADVQPTYVRVHIKGKLLQLVLPEEVNAERSTAKRSQITGHLLITMPKANQVVKPANEAPVKRCKQKNENKQIRDSNDNGDLNPIRCEKLEVDPSCASCVDFTGIVQADGDCKPKGALLTTQNWKSTIQERENSKDFVDDLDVPPLM